VAIITLPPAISIPIPGCKEFIIAREDVTNKKAWYKLSVQHNPYIAEDDFVGIDTFYKYFLFSLGLMDFPMALIVGAEGQGKSLGLAWLTHAMVKYFGKSCTLDWTPPKPELFGNYYSFYDEDFTDKIQNDLNELHKKTRM
jgi:hypothetical protein